MTPKRNRKQIARKWAVAGLACALLILGLAVYWRFASRPQPQPEVPHDNNQKVTADIDQIVDKPQSKAFAQDKDVSETQSKPAEQLGFKELITRALSKESILECVNNLQDFDDRGWVGAMVSSGRMQNPTEYWYQRVLVPRLNRVRKIMAEVSADNKEAVADLLSKKLQWSFEVCDEAAKKNREDILKGRQPARRPH